MARHATSYAPEWMTTSAAPHLVEALARVARRRPVARKLIVSPTFGGGRELLRRLSLDSGGWVGFEITTTRPLATQLAREELERSSLRIVDAFEQQALLDEALDSALKGEGPGLGDLGEGVGFREKVHGAVIAMRLSGIGPKELDAARSLSGRGLPIGPSASSCCASYKGTNGSWGESGGLIQRRSLSGRSSP